MVMWYTDVYSRMLYKLKKQLDQFLFYTANAQTIDKEGALS
ncbi:hypothetical protein [Ornithinibacillus xuwenensis]|uniref:Uncharacterized protein n=1 Tax=Ornithinibacillus xuwenensis TaxID=3144668 RepID=A0ABU9XJJ4_9BACI